MNTKLFAGIAATVRRAGRLRLTGLGVVLIALVLSGCDSSGAAVATDGLDDPSGSLAILTADLGLSESDAAAISSRMGGLDAASADVPDPGFTWELAARIHESLSREQLETLMARIQAGPGGGLRGGGMQGGRGFGPGAQGEGPGGSAARRPRIQKALSMLDLTDDQRAEIRAVHEARRDDVRALLAERDSMDPEAFRERIDALRAEIRSEVEAILTDEQVEQLEAFRRQAEERRAERQAVRETRREEARAVMADVLGLTENQVSALEALRSGRDDRRTAVRALADGGADRDRIRAFLEAERAAHLEAVREIVDERQFEIMQIHAFLAGRFAARRTAGVQGGRPGGPGVRNGGGPGSGVGAGKRG